MAQTEETFEVPCGELSVQTVLLSFTVEEVGTGIQEDESGSERTLDSNAETSQVHAVSEK